MKILILGCGGFIGSHLIAKIMSDHEVTGVDTEDYKIQDHLDNFNFIKGDIYSSDVDLYELIKQNDVVVFLASICNPSYYVRNPAETIRSNFIRPSRIAEECHKCGKWLITFSTCEIYGKTISSFADSRYSNEELYIQREDTTPSVLGPVSATRWSYASAKILLDRYITALGGDYTIIRPYNFFGARMDYLPGERESGMPRVLASFMNSLIFNKPIRLVDGGTARRVITYIDDAIDAFIRILDRKAIGHIFNIGNPNNEISMRDLAIKMRDIYGSDTEIVSVSGKEYYGKGYEDCDRRIPDITKAQELLGWSPKIGLDETIEKAVKFFIDFYKTED